VQRDLKKPVLIFSVLGITLIGIIFITGTSSTTYGIKHIVEVEPGNMVLTDTIEYDTSITSFWRPHELGTKIEYFGGTGKLLIIQTHMIVNGEEMEGITEYIETPSMFSAINHIDIPSGLLQRGHNEIEIYLNITAPENVEDSVIIHLGDYEIKTK
jgi:hypothetical protein